MTYRFSIIKRTYEEDAIIAFIDLLGTRKLYKKMPAEDLANKIIDVLVGEFDLKFSEYFSSEEMKANFDVSIFADSIAITERLSTSKLIERMVDFLLDFQEDLILNFDSPSRAIIIEDAFFSFKMTDANADSILKSQYTSISLCGGRGIRCAHDTLEGLPIGVYVAETLKKDLHPAQQARIIPVKDEEIYFIKKKTSVFPHVPTETLSLLTEDNTTILESLKTIYNDDDVFQKKAPWILVHLGKQNEIIRRAIQAINGHSRKL